MGKGGGGGPSQQNVVQTNLPEYARPYFENIMQRAQAESYRPYEAYGGERLSGFSPYQQQTQQQIMGMQTPGQFGAASGLVGSAGMQALQGSMYRPGQFNIQQLSAPGLTQYQMENVGDVASQRVNAPRMRAAQLEAPEEFGRAQAKQYMSPYMQQVVNVQKRQALEDAQKTQLAAGLGAARQGTRGGARQLLATTEREKALGQQLGDIQARGLQSSYESAQQQFERDRAASMQAGMANLNAEQQARVQNQAASLQAQGMNAEQALRAALANQQAGLTVGQQNLQALLGTQQLGAQQAMQAGLANQQQFLEAQRMAEQSRQFGGSLGMQGAQIATQAGQAMGQLGTAQQSSDMQRLQAQQQVGSQQQSLEQQRLDMQYADFLRQRDYPMEMLGYYSNLMRGIPVGLGSTSMVYSQPPSFASQAGGLGLAGLGLYNMSRGG
jgi:hypothetical protein